MMTLPITLTIAGSDPSGGAGIQADLKTFHQLGVYGTSVITLVTAQNTTGIRRIDVLPTDLVDAQLCAVLDDLQPQAVKTGALGNAGIIGTVVDRLKAGKCNLVVDPVTLSTHGKPLLDERGLCALRERLLPIATLITPNIPEAEILTGHRIRKPEDMKEAACRLLDMGSSSVLIKGGHLEGAPVDLYVHAGDFLFLHGPRIDTPHTHGTGCTQSAAIAARLALGDTLEEAVRFAKEFITRAIASGPGLGKGQGPVNHRVTF